VTKSFSQKIQWGGKKRNVRGLKDKVVFHQVGKTQKKWGVSATSRNPYMETI